MVKESQLRDAQILIIEDDEVSIRLLDETLRKAGYRNITTTNDPKRGVAIYRQIKPELVVLDLNMPQMDGFEVMRELKEIEPYPRRKVYLIIFTILWIMHSSSPAVPKMAKINFLFTKLDGCRCWKQEIIF